MASFCAANYKFAGIAPGIDRSLKTFMAATVLVADSSDSARLALRNLIQIRHPQFAVYEALDGADALQKAEALQPDLVILDPAMPPVNGQEPASVIKRILPATHVISFTVFPEILGRALCAAIGPDIVLSDVQLLEELDGLLASDTKDRNKARAARSGSP